MGTQIDSRPAAPTSEPAPTALGGGAAEAPAVPRRRWPSTTRTRIVGWVLLVVLASLTVVTFATWRLQIQAINERMDASLLSEVSEFREFVGSGRRPTDDQPFTSVREALGVAITYNLARPNEKFLGYVDGAFQFQSRQESNAPRFLHSDPAFTALVADVTEPVSGLYPSEAGEVRYLAVPATQAGDPLRGVIVAAYLADQEREQADDVARVMLGVGALTALAAAAGAWMVAGRILRPVRDIATTARSITDTDLSGRIPVDGPHGPGEVHDDPDEMRDLVRTVNAMLDRVESGVAAQRRFVDDAGHELRTPITIVRGHLEVLDPADQEDVRSTVALVDDELGRMNRMVSDLLLLARSEQPTFLHTQSVDVGELTHDIFDKIVRLGEREWALETAADVDAVLDPQRVTQAVVALADNACRYTAPGDRIAIGSQLTDGHLRFWVADNGPGVSEIDKARIFERFARGSVGGPRSEGAGLGLAIVRAIATAHDGRVLLDSIPGRGATFAVVIPAVLAPTNPDEEYT